MKLRPFFAVCCALLCAVLVTIALGKAEAQIPSFADKGEQAKAGDSEKVTGTPPPEAQEVQGTCATPRQAWLQLLYWADKDAKKAAACFEMTAFDNPSQDAPRRAQQFKSVLDANNWFIDTAGAPTDPNYTDPNSHTKSYEDPQIAGMGLAVVKQGGRWVFPATTLDRAANLYPGFINRLLSKLPPWLQTQLFGVDVWKFLGVVLLIFLALVVQRVTVFIIGTYLHRAVGKINVKYLDDAVNRAQRPIGGLAMAAVFYVGFPTLLFPLTISKIALIGTKALAAYSGVWLAYRLIDVVAEFMMAKAAGTESKLDDQLVPLITKTLKVFITVIGSIFILQNLDVDVASLLAGLGLGGLAFALAAQDTVANFFGSVMIFIDKPFQIGDWVVIAGTEGTVEEVGFRTTRVRTFYNSLVTVPNASITNTAIDNYGARQFRRYSTTLGLTYDTPPQKVQAFCESLRAVIANMEGMRKDFYMVEFKGFGDSALEIMVYSFITSATWNDEMRTKTALNLEILRIAQELGVNFAFPTQTLHVETLANHGESRPSHDGPSSKSEIISVIEQFGKGGSFAGSGVSELSSGHYCDR